MAFLWQNTSLFANSKCYWGTAEERKASASRKGWHVRIVATCDCCSKNYLPNGVCNLQKLSKNVQSHDIVTTYLKKHVEIVKKTSITSESIQLKLPNKKFIDQLIKEVAMGALESVVSKIGYQFSYSVYIACSSTTLQNTSWKNINAAEITVFV